MPMLYPSQHEPRADRIDTLLQGYHSTSYSLFISAVFASAAPYPVSVAGAAAAGVDSGAAVSTTISTRRFLARPIGQSEPSRYVLGATGWRFPMPDVVALPLTTWCCSSHSLTEDALCSLKVWLYSSEPIESVCPVIDTVHEPYCLINGLSFSITFSAFWFKLNLLKSKSTSAFNVM